MKVIILATVLSVAWSINPECLNKQKNHNGVAVHLVHSSDCRKFYKCDEASNIHEEICPNDLEYNPVLDLCDWPRGFCYPDSNERVQTIFNCSSRPDGFLYPNIEDDCKSYFHCMQGISRIGYCNNEKHFDITKGICVSKTTVQCTDKNLNLISKSRSETSKNYIRPNYLNNCKSFIQCIDDNCNEIFCPSDMAYDYHQQKCVPYENVFCDDVSYTGNTIDARCTTEHIDCYNYPDKWFPELDDCTQFFICYNDEPILQQCHYGQIFLPELESCVEGDSSTCTPNTPKPPTDKPPTKGCQNQPDGTVLPHKTECSKYNLCENGKEVEQTCPIGSKFDNKLLVCIPDDDGSCACEGKQSGLMVPHKDCDKFLVCYMDSGILEECGEGNVFDTSYCRPDVDHICWDKPSSDICKDKPNYSFVKYDNCSELFYICFDGVEYLKSCGNGLIFDTEKLHCILDDGTCGESPPNPTDDCQNQPDGTMIKANDDNCGSFYICFKQQIGIKQKCPAGSKFEDGNCIKDNQCNVIDDDCYDKPFGTLVPNPTECDQYYICMGDSKSPVQHCDDDKYFDGKYCVKDTKSQCKPCRTKPDNGEVIKDSNDQCGFYVCLNGEGIKQSCGKNQIFNPLVNACIPDTDNICVDCTNVPNNENIKGPECYQYYTCVDGVKSEVMECPFGTKFEGKTCQVDTDKPQCRPFDEQCLDKVNGEKVPGELCDEYHTCINHNKTSVQTCLSGYRFDETKSDCVVDVNKQCDTRCRNKENGFIFADETSCYKFFVCNNNVTVPQQCSNDKRFDAKLKVCVPDKDDGNLCRDKICQKQPNGEYLPHDSDCSKFYICFNEKKVEQSCGNGSAFDSKVKGCVEDLTEECTQECQGKLTGTFVENKDDCNTFYVCNQGRKILQHCGNNKYFNAKLGVCVVEDGTCNGDDICRLQPDGKFIAKEGSCNEFYVCLYGKGILQECGSDKYFNQELGICMTGPCVKDEDCEGKPNGSFIANPNNSSEYYLCYNNEKIPQKCPPGATFDPKYKVCVYGGSGGNEDCKKGDDGKLLPNHNDPTGTEYFICYNGIKIPQTCPVGSIFDPIYNACIPKGSVPVDYVCKGKPNGAHVGGPSLNCHEFYLCLNEKPVKQSCSKGSAFDAKKGYCVPDDNNCWNNLICLPTDVCSFKPNENKCSKFYLCRNGVAIPLECEEGTIFDENLGCVPGVCGKTLSGRSLSSLKNDEFVCNHGTVTSLESNCAKYKYCLYGIWSNRDCPSMHYFNKERNVCIADDKTCPSVIKPTLPFENGGKPIEYCTANKLRHDEDNCANFYVCTEGIWRHQNCPAGTYFNRKVNYCMPDDKSCEHVKKTTEAPITTTLAPVCVNGKMETVKENCAQFRLCVLGQWRLQTCPPEKLFDANSNRCIFDEHNTCPTVLSLPPPVEEPTFPSECEHMTKRPIENYCHMFQLCVTGQWWVQTCPSNTYFSIIDNRCIEDKDNACNNVDTSKYSTTTLPSTTVDPIPLKCVEGDKTSLVNNCHGYNICIEGVWTTMKCPSGYYYNTLIDLCEQEYENSCQALPSELSPCNFEGQEVPNVYDCSSYLKCKSGWWVPFKCQDKHYFSASEKKCTLNSANCFEVGSPNNTTPIPQYSTTNANPADICEGRPNGAMLPHESDNTKLYLCWNEIATIQKCANNFYFNKDVEACVEKESSTPSDICEGRPNGAMLPHESDNTKLYLCWDEIATIQKCETNFYFNEKVEACVEKESSTPSDICEGRPNGAMLPHESDNTKLYLCWDEIATIQKCETNFYFNEKVEACVEKESSTPSDICEGRQNGAMLPHEADNTKLYICWNGIATIQKCAKDLYFDDTVKACVEKIKTCGEYANKALIADKEDCSQYYVCVNGTLSAPLKCPTGTYFHELQYCIPDNSICSEQTQKQKNICVGQHGTYLAHEDKCDAFYLCIRGYGVPYGCPLGYKFSQSEAACVVDTKNECNSDGTKFNSTSPCTSLSDGIYLEDKLDCNKFFVCSNGYPIPKKCPSGSYFDKTKRVCMPDQGQCQPLTNTPSVPPNGLDPKICEGKHGLLIEDPANCFSFYICLYGKARHEQCVEGQYFNTKQKQCQTNDGVCLAKRSQISCDNQEENSNLVNQKDCRLFKECQNKIATESKCRNGEFFDSILGYCRQNDSTCLLENGQRVGICAGKHGQIVAAEECNQYNVCLNGQKIPMKCDRGEYFDKSAVRCFKDYNNECEVNESVEGPSSNFTNPKISCNGMKERVLYPNIADNCESFFECDNGHFRVQNCPNGLLFSAITGMCDWKTFVNCPSSILNEAREMRTDTFCNKEVDGVRYANLQNGCKSFYVCDNGIAQHINCGKGLLYNPFIGTCVFEKNFTCPINV